MKFDIGDTAQFYSGYAERIVKGFVKKQEGRVTYTLIYFNNSKLQMKRFYYTCHRILGEISLTKMVLTEKLNKSL